MRHKLMFFLTGLVLLSLTLTSAGGVQAQGPDPLQRKMPMTGIPFEPVTPSEPAEGTVLTELGPNLVSDPSFEASFPFGPPWYSTSMNFPTVLCTTAACGNGGGTAGPRTGNVWTWLGGIAPQNESGSVYQSVLFPSCGATLQFYLWIGAATRGSDANDRFFVKIDDTQVFSANATQKSLYPSYKLVTVNANAFADGATHTIRFWGITTNQLVTFNVDDVSLTSGPCVTISGNAGLGSAVINYFNVRPQGFVVQSDGSYSFNVPLHWSGTVTPSFPYATFIPASRTYSNLTANRTGQNYAPWLRIAGNAGVGGATLDYTVGGTPMTTTSGADGKYSLLVPANWTGTVTPSHPCFTFTPPAHYYYSMMNAEIFRNYTPSFNSGAGCADINVSVGGVDRGRFGLLSQGSTRASFPGVNGGPVEIQSANAISLMAAERVIYKVQGVNTSFSEMMGLPDSQLDTTYWLPWYNNVGLDTQLRFANVSGSTATVQLFIGGVEKTTGCTPSSSPYTLAVGESLRVSCAGVDSGPVEIRSTQNIVAAERVIYKVNGVHTSFSEIMALPNKQLDTTYWLPWYNNVGLDTQLRFGNVSNTEATVQLFIGGQEMTSGCTPSSSPYTLQAGESLRVSCAGVDSGPVEIRSTQDIVAAERVIYKVNGVYTSFSEMMALPNGLLDTTYRLPWYNNVGLDTQLRFGNVSNTEATVQLFIGGQEMTSGCTPSNSPYTLQAGESLRVSCAGVDNGPVQIVSTQDIVAAERVIYKVNGVNTSFSEMMALPNGLLDATFWLPWYNSVDLDTQLRFGVP